MTMGIRVDKLDEPVNPDLLITKIAETGDKSDFVSHEFVGSTEQPLAYRLSSGSIYRILSGKGFLPW